MVSVFRARVCFESFLCLGLKFEGWGLFRMFFVFRVKILGLGFT